MAELLEPEGHAKLLQASQDFLKDEKYGHPQVENVMNDVFGDYQTRAHNPTAQAWSAYWVELAKYEETKTGALPQVPGLAAEKSTIVEQMDMINDDEQEEITDISLRPRTAADREEERQRRKHNGNVPPKSKATTGAPMNMLMAELFIEGLEKSSKGEMVKTYYCIGCDKSSRNNSTTRSYPHAQSCAPLARYFPLTQKKVVEELGGKSTASILSGDSAAPAVRTKKRKVTDTSHGRVPLDLEQGKLNFPSKIISSEQQTRIDYFLLRFIICCSIAFAVLDNGFFIDLVNALCSVYPVPSRSDFMSIHMAAEVVSLMKNLREYLNSFCHLTLSFDGWSSRLNDEIYTVHVTTPLRRSFLIGGLVLTGLSVTGELLCEKLSEASLITDLLAAVLFSLVVSDTTGNVKKARELICKKWPWILNCGDPCHQLNLMAKDIIVGSKRHGKVKPFAEVLGVVAAFTSYFSHSNYGKYWLREELAKETDKRGIETAGATRFSSFSTNAKSIERCYGPMKRAYQSGKLQFATKAAKKIEKYLQNGPTAYTFLASLNSVNMLLTPIDRGLKTLEGQNVTCSDVFLVYTGIAIGFKNVFKTEESLREYELQTYQVFNRRFTILMTESTTDMFLLGYLLDPVYFRDRALRLNLPPREAFSKATASPLVMRLITAALIMLSNEQARISFGGKDQAERLIKQLTGWLYMESPFNETCSNLENRLAWWQGRGEDSRTDVIAIIGIKLFSVSPSEMCDERTASKMTASNTAKRNGLSGIHIIQMAQLQQHWTYGLEAPKYIHTSHLNLPKGKKPTTKNPKTHLSTPRLADLLNPVTDDEEAMFNNPDPYGIDELTDDEDDEEMFPTVVRGAPRLQIEDIVDLNQPRLLARYNGKDDIQMEEQSRSAKEARARPAEWTREQYSMADIQF